MVYRVKYIPTAVSAVGILYLEIFKFYKKEQALKSGKYGVELYAEDFKIGTGSLALK
jgi:hypothetical protein